MRRLFSRTLAIVVIASIALGSPAVSARLEAAALLLRLTRPAHAPSGLAAFGAREVLERRVELPRDGADPMAAWRFRPRGPRGEPAPGLVLIHGVQRDGLEDPRVRHLGRSLASAGFDVLLPDLASLRAYRVEPAALDDIAAAAAFLARDLGHAKVGLYGVSFGGGLALALASDPRRNTHIGAAISVGGHHDLARVLGWALGQPTSGPDDARYRTPPEPYVRLVLAHRYADALFSPTDVDTAREALARHLRGDAGGGRSLVDALDPDGQRRYQSALVGGPEVTEALLAVLEENHAELQEVSSRDRLSLARVPLFVAHGTGDAIIPTTEAAWIAQELGVQQLGARELGVKDRVLVTPLLTHLTLDRDPPLRESWRAIEWTRGWLEAARALESAR